MPSSVETNPQDKKPPVVGYVLAGVSFIPLIGVLFGLLAIIWGLLNRRRSGLRVALIGGAGICFTVLVYSALFYFGMVQRGGIYDSLRARMAQDSLNSLVKSVEFYKLTHSRYPDSLDELKSSFKPASREALDLMDTRIGWPLEVRPFYYKKVDAAHYYLRGVAPDGNPFSPGALVPQIEGSRDQLGLLIDPPR